MVISVILLFIDNWNSCYSMVLFLTGLIRQRMIVSKASDQMLEDRVWSPLGSVFFLVLKNLY